MHFTQRLRFSPSARLVLRENEVADLLSHGRFPPKERQNFGMGTELIQRCERGEEIHGMMRHFVVHVAG